MSILKLLSNAVLHSCSLDSVTMCLTYKPHEEQNYCSWNLCITGWWMQTGRWWWPWVSTHWKQSRIEQQGAFGKWIRSLSAQMCNYRSYLNLLIPSVVFLFYFLFGLSCFFISIFTFKRPAKVISSPRWYLFCLMGKYSWLWAIFLSGNTEGSRYMVLSEQEGADAKGQEYPGK